MRGGAVVVGGAVLCCAQVREERLHPESRTLG